MATTALYFDETVKALTGTYEKMVWAQPGGVEAMDLISTEGTGGDTIIWSLDGTNDYGKVGPGAVKQFAPKPGRYHKFLYLKSSPVGATYRLEQA